MIRMALLVCVGLLLTPGQRPGVRPPAPPEPLLLAVAVETTAGKVRLDTTGAAGTAVPLARAHVGEAVRARWFVRNKDRKRPYPQSVFHFFITRVEAPGEALPPQPKPGTILDSSFAEELAAGAGTVGTSNLPIHEPGVYRVQLEVLDRLAVRQQACGVDLKVED